MIVKYFNHGIWGFIDNVRQVAHSPIDTRKLIEEYDAEVKAGTRGDNCFMDCLPNGEPITKEIHDTNKAFVKVLEDYDKRNDLIGESHSENLLHEDLIEDNLPASIVLLYLNDHKEYDNVIFVTNQGCYLLNDKGQTIERLV